MRCRPERIDNREAAKRSDAATPQLAPELQSLGAASEHLSHLSREGLHGLRRADGLHGIGDARARAPRYWFDPRPTDAPRDGRRGGIDDALAARFDATGPPPARRPPSLRDDASLSCLLDWHSYHLDHDPVFAHYGSAAFAVVVGSLFGVARGLSTALLSRSDGV